jgi:hypothetical protein
VPVLRQRQIRFGEAERPDRRSARRGHRKLRGECSRFTAAENFALRYCRTDGDRPRSRRRRISRCLAPVLQQEEIVELGTFIGFNIGYHTFFGTLKFYPMFSPDGRLVSQEESERVRRSAVSR